MDTAYYHEMARVEDHHWWFAARRQIVAAVLDQCDLSSDAQVLEVGCGTGGNLSLLASYGSLYACEPEDEARELAQDRRLGRIETGSLPDHLPFQDQTFDLIALLDVLEHVDEDEAALRSLHTRMKPGGYLLLTVPAYLFLWSAHDDINHHKRRYTQRELTRKVQAAGFTLCHATYFNTTLFPIVATVRLASRFSTRTGSDLKMPGDGINTLLQRIFAGERHWVPRRTLPFGVSILVLAQRAR